MITQLRDKAFASDESDDTTTVEVFGSGDDETRIAWAKQGEVQRIFASDVPLTVTDMSGSTTSVEPEDGEVTLTLGASPVFISSESE